MDVSNLFGVDLSGEYQAEEDEEDHTEEVKLKCGEAFKVSLASDDFNKEKKTLFATYLWSGSLTLADFIAGDLCTERLLQKPEQRQQELETAAAPAAAPAVPLATNTSYPSDPSSLSSTSIGPLTGMSLVELGAGSSGLPSMVAMRRGGRVVVTDFPAESVIKTLRANIEREEQRSNCAIVTTTSSSSCKSSAGCSKPGRGTVVPHMWGSESVQDVIAANDGELFDVVLSAECLWKSDTHRALLTSVAQLIKPDKGRVYISFSHHHPGREETDLNFFMIAKNEFGLHTLYTQKTEGEHMWSSAKKDIFLYELYKPSLCSHHH